ncbi:hypothetical protein KKI93_24315, partial [Xenorhabdus bovienii]|uniref:hypothetical protein n=1 Tax=Xenorhabdus bovienii TaxID=40576 RepID=UPI0023B34BC6
VGLQTSVGGQDGDVMLATLPETLRMWLEKKGDDKETASSVEKRSFWPKYPFDHSSLLYAVPKKKNTELNES